MRLLFIPIKRLLRIIRDFRSIHNFYKESSGAQVKGVFSSFEEAKASLPKEYRVSYDHEVLANQYKDELLEAIHNNKFELHSYDYPLLVWLKEILREGTVLCDFGGNVGVHFYTYTHRVTFPSQIKWLIVDLPHIVNAGNQINKKFPDNRLDFYTDIKMINKPDIFLASGSLQYLEDLSFLEQIEATHILINRIGVYEGETFVTLQNGGKVFYPQYIFNRVEFLNYFIRRGYEMVDEWENTIDHCYVPFHPDKCIAKYSGFYLKRADAGRTF